MACWCVWTNTPRRIYTHRGLTGARNLGEKHRPSSNGNSTIAWAGPLPCLLCRLRAYKPRGLAVRLGEECRSAHR